MNYNTPFTEEFKTTLIMGMGNYMDRNTNGIG